MPRYNIDEWELRIREACETSSSMREAASKLPMNIKTFKRLAEELGVYSPNQAGKGVPAQRDYNRYETKDILEGKYPGYQTFKLKNRLLKEGIKERKCEVCGNTEWMGQPIPVELHHIDGDSSNNRLENLQILCPNCHAFTDTYRAKNKKV